MANTYTKIYIHYIFAVKERCPLLRNKHQKQIYSYIAAKCKENDYFLSAIGGTDNHLHLLITIQPTQSVSEVARILKGSASHYINKMKISPKHFEWQVGYGAFSVSQSSMSKVCAYIRNQEIHHQKLSFREEFQTLLDKYQVKYESKYLFDEVKGTEK